MGIILNRRACAVVLLAASTAPMVAGAQVQSFDVDCGLGQSIGSTLAQGDSRKPMVIAVRGTCTENVTISRDDVTLQGQTGGSVAAASPSTPAITVRGTRVVIDGLKVSGGLYAVLVTGSHDVVVSNCEIRNAQQNGLHVENGFVTVRANTISNNGIAGIFLRGSRGRLEVNQINSNTGPGISAAQRSVVSAANNTITGNGGQGVDLVNGATLALNGGTIASNAFSGIQISASQATIGGVTITGNGTKPGLIENQRRGVTALQSSIQILNSTISGNTGRGVAVEIGSSLSMQNTSVTGNGDDGIILYLASVANFAGNVNVNGNSRSGLSILVNSTAQLGQGSMSFQNIWIGQASSLFVNPEFVDPIMVPGGVGCGDFKSSANFIPRISGPWSCSPY